MEAWGGELEQVTMEAHVPGGIAERFWDRVTDDGIDISIMLGVGLVIGIAMTQFIKTGWRAWWGEPVTQEARGRRGLQYRVAGGVIAGAWTAGLVWRFGFWEATSAGLIAAGMSGKTYDGWHNYVLPSIKKVWAVTVSAFIEWIRKKFGGGGGSPPGSGHGDAGDDSTRTNYRP